jgi:SPW repeat
MKRHQRQDWINLLLGLWMLVSTWIIGRDAGSVAIVNYYVVGVAVAAFAIAALTAFRIWEEWVNLVLGTWLLVSPWFLGFSAMSAVGLNTLLIAIFVVFCSGSALSEGTGGKPAPK